jgi:hypothetical protein
VFRASYRTRSGVHSEKVPIYNKGPLMVALLRLYTFVVVVVVVVDGDGLPTRTSNLVAPMRH